MTGISELTALFHSINGANIKEKYTNFNNFLELLNSNLNEEESLKHFIKSIEAKTFLEEIFRIEIIILSKNKELLLDELKQCNEIFVKKLLKNWKLFEELFLNITPTDLVKNILPYLSYSLKFKVLNGICKNIKNEELLDEYFNALEEKYGLKIAASILPGCSVNLIKSKVENFHLKLSQPHLKAIFKKDKQFVEFYFNTLKKKYENINFTDDYLSTLKYVAKVDPHIYWKLHDKFELTVKFGKYMTPGMVKTHKSISEYGYSALDTFHYLKLFRTTKKEGTLKSFLLSLFPEAHDKFKDQFLTDNILKFIQKGPVSQQYRLVSSFFTEKYKRILLDYPDYFTEDLLKITPFEEREFVLDCKVNDNEELHYLYRPSISISRLKTQLQHSSDSKTRGKIGLLLCKTCAANKDAVALLDVLRYILNKHKNDSALLSTFFSHLMEWPNIKKLSTEHWQYIARINKILEKTPSHYWTSTKFFESYAYHLIDNHKPIQDIVKTQIQNMIECRSTFLYFRDKNYHKKYCDELASCLDSYKEHEKYKIMCKNFTEFIQCRLNFKKEDLSHYVRFFDQLYDDDDDDSICFQTCFQLELIREDRIHEKFWKSNRIINNQFVLWYAEHRPDLLRKNLEKLTNFVDMCYVETFLREFKKICNSDVLKEFKDQALHHIQNENYSKAVFLINAIAALDPEYFSELIIPLLPAPDGKIVLEEVATEKANLQKGIAKGLSKVRGAPSKSFPLILKFCVGDYLKFALQPLYKSVYNMPEFQVKNYLNKLSDSAISVRKHVLYLSKDVFTSDDFYELLRDWSRKETNLSMRNILLKESIRDFIDNPSERIWLLLNSNLKSIDADDREMYDFLLKFEKIPLDYLSKYLEIIYEAVSNNSDPNINGKRIQLIDRIPTVIIRILEEKFLKQIINDTVFGEVNTDFCWKCVFYANEDIQLALFEENLAQLKQFVEKNSLNLEQNTKIRSKISFFVNHFFNLAVKLKQGLNYTEKFISAWSSMFHTETLYKDYLFIKFADLYFKSGFDSYHVGLKMNELLYEYISKYNNSIIDFFCSEVCNFLTTTSITQKDEDMYKFVEGMFHEKKDENIYIAIIYFLPKTLPNIDNMYAKYIPIMRAVEECDSPIVQYHFDDYLT